jgi:hypothetical protein
MDFPYGNIELQLIKVSLIPEMEKGFGMPLGLNGDKSVTMLSPNCHLESDFCLI